MARYIDADELKELRHSYIQGKINFDGSEYDLIDKCPTADVVEVKHGYWIPVQSSDMSTGKAYKCSECDKMRYGCRLPPYCQECGVKMDLKGGVNND